MKTLIILKTPKGMKSLISDLSPLNSNISTLNSIYKANFLKVILLMLVGAFISSCKKDTYQDLTVINDNTPLVITSSKETITLSEADFDKEALALSWTSGINHGTNSSISYKVYIDKQGNNFTDAIIADLGKANYSKKYSVKDLNNLLINTVKLTPGVEATLEAKVVTSISGYPNLSDSSQIVLKVTPYKAVTTTLFLIGDATPKGWDAGNATEMLLNASSPGKFTWQGRLNAGEFKFITTKGSFSPSYTKGASATQLMYRTLDSQPDNKFVVTASGLYSVSVNLLDLSITVTEGAAPPYANLWVVGDATPNGWNIDNPNEMRADAGNLYVFNYNEVLKAGEFKIPVAKGNWGADFYMPLVNAQALNLTDVSLVTGGSPDKKWKITTPGAYKIKLDLETMKIYIKPFTAYTQLWMVGDATPAGWNIDNPTPLTVSGTNPYIFTYTGALSVGEFKIPVAKGNWGGDFFMPEINAAGTGNSGMRFVPGGNPDFKWKITQAGNYIITVDQLHESISIVKQ